jgi:anti-sigma regulatory factor (Ser/Thr protein kinase)
VTDQERVPDFRHEALLYRGESDFVDQIAPFVIDGRTADEPTLVMVSAAKIDALRKRIGAADDGLIEYRDMQVAGSNPARIIPAWDEFAAASTDKGATAIRGVGEPIWPDRTPTQVEECHWHEALINNAFAQVQGFWLVCPYDVAGLDPGIVRVAQSTHPVLSDRLGAGSRQRDDRHERFLVPTTPLASPLTQPGGVLAEMDFEAGSLGELRALVAREGARVGLSPSRLDDMVLAVNEVATNSVTHGGGRGAARVWCEGGDMVFEVSDRGVISDPLVDRHRPGSDTSSARGLWTVNQLCDLVQLRSSRDAGSVVRLLVHIEHLPA